MNIIKETQNPLFKRKEVIFELASEVTPSHADVAAKVEETLSIKPETFKVKKIDSSFGSKVFKITVNVYESPEAKNATEVKTKQEKEAEAKAIEEAKAAAAEAKKAAEEEKKAAEEAKKAEEEAKAAEAEKPAEEVKEEAAPEEKSE